MWYYALGSFLNAASMILLNIIFIVGFHLGAYGMNMVTHYSRFAFVELLF